MCRVKILGKEGPFYFFDCDTREPAKAFVVAAELPFFRAAAAFASIGLLVVLSVPDCARALPARLRCKADALAFPSVRPADDATFPPVDFPAMLDLLSARATNHYWLTFSAQRPL